MGNKQQTLAAYKIETDVRKMLGKGVFGIVMPGVRTKDNHKIAAKKITIEKDCMNETVVGQEAEILLHKLKPHENVVRVYDFMKEDVVENGTAYVNLWLIMERCPLINLKVYANQKELNFGKKVDIMHQCAVALAHLHGNKPSITHRDLKPENILVSGTRDSPIIKLGDFGTARTVDKIQGRYVTMKSLAGTFDYFAPELCAILADEEPLYDRTVDLFSLGLCFLALLQASKGKAMRAWKENDKCLGRVMWENRKTGYVVHLDAPGDSKHVTVVKAIIATMLQADPKDRPLASEVLAKLARLRPEVCGTPELKATGYGLAKALPSASSVASPK